MEKETKNKIQTVVLDAKDKIFGRLASEVAKLLIGKNKIDFLPNRLNQIQVVVKNISQIKFSGKKVKQKKYYHYSGYPGGLKTKTLEEFIKKNPSLAFKKAVSKMLPKNKLRDKLLKKLKIEN